MKKEIIILLIAFSYGFNSSIAQSISNNLPAFSKKYNDKMFGENVFVFEPNMNMTEIQTLIDSMYHQQHPKTSEFSTNRYALFFKPGTYQLNLKLGYYMHALGLGKSPNDVIINGVLMSKGFEHGHVLVNFWRSVENLTIVVPAGVENIWGVSQAAPLRRVHIKGDLKLHDNGWSSGGYIADSKIDGTVDAGGQQQWFTRNVDLKTWKGGQWNVMFVGVPNAPADKWPNNPYTVIKEMPLVREKPYLIHDEKGFHLVLPKLKKNTSGISWAKGMMDDKIITKRNFYIAKPNIDNAETINAALSEGKNLIFSPGIYNLTQSIKVKKAGTIVMGLGMATLVSMNGNAAMELADVNGISVAGITIDAGEMSAEMLLQVGEPNSNKSHAKCPTFLYDIFFRIGGYGAASASSCMVINSKNVCIDHTWLWRADHGKEVAWAKNTCKNGLIVNGDKVNVYGLFCEHFQEYQTLWNGNHGKMYFYQSEMPYDPPSVEAWKHGTINGYASYKVSDKVTHHEAWALGIYCVFNDAPIKVSQAIETPSAIEKDIHHKIIYWLYGGNKESVIQSIINGKGDGVGATKEKSIIE
jgi:hypothetical protein